MYHFNKKGSVALFTLLCILLFSSVQGWLELSFNTSTFEERTYYTPVGTTVALTCIVPRNGGQVRILKRTNQSNGKWEYIRLVDKEKLSEIAAGYETKYSIVLADVNTSLVIHNLTKSDSSNYRCNFKGRKCSKPIRGKRSCRSESLWKTVSLEVTKKSDMSSLPEFCDLVSDTDGLYFVGEDLTLRCPKNVSNIKANESSIATNVTRDGKYFNLITIHSLTEKYNATEITCFRLRDADMSEDYCRRLPNISIFSNLTVTLSPNVSGILQGGSANYTCQSHPFLSDSFEWDILENDLTFGNVTISDTLDGSQLWIENIDFRTSNSSSLSVNCTVTIGSRNESQTATIYPISSMNRTENTENESSGKAGFVISIIVSLVLLLIGVITLGFFYMKVKSRSKRKDVAKNVNVKQDFEIMERHQYQTEKDMKAQLGLTGNDSEVMENVAYMSYNETLRQ